MALPVRTGPTDRRDDVVRMLTASPAGLSDAALAEALGGPEAGVRTQTINQLCRRMVAEGRLERVGSRPILNRLVPPPKPARKRRGPNGTARTNGSAPPGGSAPPSDPPAPEDVAPPTETPPEPVEVAAEPGPAEVVALPEPTEPGPAEPSAVPAYDALQAWSRAVNVQARVATWLTRRGATIRSATASGQGPARELVVVLDGDDVHVEITGWPQDGARTHPTTIAGDWFLAAAHAAGERRRAHPRARIVIALPDTRRYRALTRDRAPALDGARAEVWFVDPEGSVHAHGASW